MSANRRKLGTLAPTHAEAFLRVMQGRGGAIHLGRVGRVLELALVMLERRGYVEEVAISTWRPTAEGIAAWKRHKELSK